MKQTDVQAMLAALDGAKDGLTTHELKAATPGTDGKARSNALYNLRRAHQVKRVRGRWMRVRG